MSEKRHYERINLKGNAIIRSAQLDYSFLSGCLQNISFGGFSIISYETINIDSIVEFELMSNALSGSITGKAKVKYILPKDSSYEKVFSIGFEFLEINKDTLAHLINRIELKNSESRTEGQIDFIPY